jgi:Amidohydrolase
VEAHVNPVPDVASLTAIDVHVHAEVSSTGQHSLASELEQASAAYFKAGGQRKPTLPEIAALHEQQVHIDLSGWSPKYFPPILVQYANSLLADKVLFGSDFPLLTPDRWLADFAKLDIKPEVREKIMKQNAARLLGLATG